MLHDTVPIRQLQLYTYIFDFHWHIRWHLVELESSSFRRLLLGVSKTLTLDLIPWVSFSYKCTTINLHCLNNPELALQDDTILNGYD